jgi:hypothetical protein
MTQAQRRPPVRERPVNQAKSPVGPKPREKYTTVLRSPMTTVTALTPASPGLR